MFYNCKSFEGKGLDKWDVSKTIWMNIMFYKCKNLDCDLSKWNVSNVKNMSNMFNQCIKFNCNLSKWNVSNAKDMNGMFYGCNSLKNTPSWYTK